MSCLVKVLSQHNLISTDAIVTTKLLKISVLQLIPAVLYWRKKLDPKKEKLARELGGKMNRVREMKNGRKDVVCANIDNPHYPVRIMWDTAWQLSPPSLLPYFLEFLSFPCPVEGELWKACRAAHAWHCSILYLSGFLSHVGLFALNSGKDWTLSSSDYSFHSKIKLIKHRVLSLKILERNNRRNTKSFSPLLLGLLFPFTFLLGIRMFLA